MSSALGSKCCSAAIAGILAAAGAVASTPGGPAAESEGAEHPLLLDARGIFRLLDVMDAVAAGHPGLEQEAARLEALPAAERELALDAARLRNTKSAAVAAAFDAMMATPTYEMYFRRFPNVTAELVRDLILDLPYRRRQAPGDIGSTFHELIRRRHAVRAAVDRFIERIDMAAVEANARRWSPQAAGPLPTTHLIYDSNAGSFAAEGKPFLNLYAEGYFEHPSPEPEVIAEIAGTMAHELQHALVDPILYPRRPAVLPWRWEQLDGLLRSMVGEGVANHCNPPGGARRDLYEDEEVVAALLRRLEVFLSDLRRSRLDEEGAIAWRRENFFGPAEALLRSHLEKSFGGEELEAKIVEQTPIRPDLEHVLGWWMVSRVSRGGARRELALGLLDGPWALPRLYNEAVAPERADLRLSDQAIEDLAVLEGLGPAASPAPVGR